MKKQSLLTTLLLFFVALTTRAATYYVAPLETPQVYITQDDASFRVNVTNFGDEVAVSITYSLTDTELGKEIDAAVITFESPLQKGETRAVEIKMTPSASYTKRNLLLRLSQVNGHANKATKNWIYIDCYTVTHIPQKRLVVEDYTAMWCGYCPRGIVTMEYLRRIFPEAFVGIAIHCANGSYDKLDSDAYGASRYQWATSFPTLMVNRKQKINEWIEGESMFNNEMLVPAIMDVSVSAVWQDDSTSISVNTEVTPRMHADTDRYGIAYVLIEDGMGDPTWMQRNYLSGDKNGTAPPEYDRFANGGKVMRGLVYDHVAIASLDIEEGMDNSLEGDFTPDETKRHTAVFENINQHSIIQNKKNMSVIAMVIDKQTKQIENSAQCAITAAGTTGIETAITASSPSEPCRFNLQGIRVGKDYKGIVIENGKKIIVR